MNHLFLFSTSRWMGEGVIRLSAIDETLLFLTEWSIALLNPSPKEFGSKQEVRIADHSESIHNEFLFTNIQDKKFDISLENPSWGKVFGKGIYDDLFIGWEFRSNEVGFEGYEFYELQGDKSYKMKAEYVTADDLRTSVEGKIWQHIEGDT